MHSNEDNLNVVALVRKIHYTGLVSIISIRAAAYKIPQLVEYSPVTIERQGNAL